MKRTVFILADQKYGGAWLYLKGKYYASDEASYEQLAISLPDSPFLKRAKNLNDVLQVKASELRKAGVRDTHLLDQSSDELKEAAAILRDLKNADLVSSGDDLDRHVRLLTLLKKACNFPHAV